MSVQEIKEAVQHLSLEERAEVAACLHSWSDDKWDEKMKRDLASGKLDKILARPATDENLTPREALRRLQADARMTSQEAENYLHELREEPLTAENRRPA